MKRNHLFLGLIALMLLFTGCEREKIEVDASLNIIESANERKLITNEITAHIVPTTLQVGEELSITVTHNEEKSISVKIFSESLGLQTVITTPGKFTQNIDIAGLHDLAIEYKPSSSVTRSIKTDIEVVSNEK